MMVSSLEGVTFRCSFYLPCHEIAFSSTHSQFNLISSSSKIPITCIRPNRTLQHSSLVVYFLYLSLFLRSLTHSLSFPALVPSPSCVGSTPVFYFFSKNTIYNTHTYISAIKHLVGFFPRRVCVNLFVFICFCNGCSEKMHSISLDFLTFFVTLHRPACIPPFRVLFTTFPFVFRLTKL